MAPTELGKTRINVGDVGGTQKSVLQPNIIVIHLDDAGQGDWTTYHDARYEWVDLDADLRDDHLVEDGQAGKEARNWIDDLWANKDTDGGSTIGSHNSHSLWLDCPSNPADELDPRVSSNPFPANSAQGRDNVKRTVSEYKCEWDYVTREQYEKKPGFYDGMYDAGTWGTPQADNMGQWTKNRCFPDVVGDGQCFTSSGAIIQEEAYSMEG